MTHVSIVGAGSVGVAAANAILHQRIAKHVTFFDVDERKAEGEAMDFAHAAAMFGSPKVQYGSMQSLVTGDVCILSAGVKMRSGETRLALLKRNIEVAHSLADAMEKSGKLPKILVVLTNPVDVITEVFMRRWHNRSDVRIFGTGTSLDTMRLRQSLATFFSVHPANVHAWVVGEHGDSSAILLDHARIGCYSLEEFAKNDSTVRFDGPAREAIRAEVRSAAYRIIERKGATAHGIGMMAGRLARAILRDENAIFPVSVRVRDSVCASLPCLIGIGGARLLPAPQMSPTEQHEYDTSVALLESACAAL